MAITQSTPLSFLATTAFTGGSFKWTQSYTADSDVMTIYLLGAASNNLTITYAGDALSLEVESNDGGAGETKGYSLTSPASGSNDIIIDSFGSQRTWLVIVSSESGVDILSPISGVATDNGFKGALSCAPVTVTDGFVTDAILIWDTFTAVAGAGQTATISGVTATTNYIGYASKETATGASTTMSWALTGSDNRVSQAAIAYNPAGGLTLDAAVSTMAKAETNVSFIVSTPATVPTTGNTTVINSGDALTVTSVTGSDPYTINCTVPLNITKQADDTGYAWTITVDAENVVTALISLTAQDGWSNIVTVNPLTTVGYMANGFTGDAPVSNDTMEWETTDTLNPGLDTEWIFTTAPLATVVVARRFIQVDGTVGATADVTFTVSAAGGIVRPLVSSIVSNIVKPITS